jgi:porphobilinogen synthase
VTRLRRLRRTGALRSLVRETRLDLEDFVMPLFVGPHTEQNDALPAMGRWSVEEVGAEVDRLVAAGVRAVILFGIPDEKDDEGSGAWDDDGVIQRALRELRSRFPELVLLTDVCLCEYTDHGHCGVIVDGQVDNDTTLDLLARTAVSHVDAGADAVCPSDMMDGRVAAIREALPETPIVAYSAKYASSFYGPFREAADSAPSFGDRRGYQMDPANVREALPETPILAYSAKYASSFYGPFREAADSAPSFGDRRGYQMDPANVREALRECELDVAEGADVIMVKPALPYLDVIRAARERFDLPLAAYNVSGEYAMVKAASARGWLDEQTAALESLTAIKRAGADVVVSYWTKDLASWL